MDKKKNGIPKLRFPGFTGAWEQRKLGEVVKRETCQVISSDNNPSVEYDDVVSEQGELNKDVLAKHSVKKGIQFNKNHILYGKLRPYLHNWLNPNFKGVAVGDWWVLKPKNDIKKSFLYALIQTQRYDNVANISTGSKMPRADWNLVSNTNFAIPSQLDEQLKIGEVFSQLDSLITLHQRKLDHLKEQKKGLLQKMFPKKGEVVPEVRFPGFTNAWEQRKLGDISKTKRGLTYKPFNIDNTGIRVLRSSNIKEDTFVISDDDVFVKESAVNIPFVENGDILITAANGSTNLVGKHAIIRDIPKNSAVHGGFMLITTSKEYEFLNALMSSNWYKKFIKKYVAGGNGAIGNLRKNDLDNQKIYVPKKDEQEKIGNFFKMLDSLITLHQRKLDHLKLLKKGLLQQMFV
ncbi:restriction endonuclease subunit S [Ligilactobacillus saerimneri]|uniref:restriction endonuclease subunit S n=3 Tax=Ligilactobacillus saerimneri TaxID=228229 RepID=UPI0024B8AA5F|nr:restriction endonuclease subunit S [Ligilactobacillus saerimneri]